VFGGRECAWAEIYRRAKAAGELSALTEIFVPPKDRTLRGTCSWMNLALGRDHHGAMDHQPAGNAPASPAGQRFPAAQPIAPNKYQDESSPSR
jgi:hypothetical protein